MRLKPQTGILIAVGVWCLMVVVLANAYAATLLSFQSVTKQEPGINSLDELANSKSCQLLIQGDSDLANDFLVSLNSQRIKTAGSQLNNLFYTNFRMQRMARTT